MQPLESGEPCPKPTPEESGQTFIKRIVAVGGDPLSVKDGHPVVNGVEKTDARFFLAGHGQGRAAPHAPAPKTSPSSWDRPTSGPFALANFRLGEVLGPRERWRSVLAGG